MRSLRHPIYRFSLCSHVSYAPSNRATGDAHIRTPGVNRAVVDVASRAEPGAAVGFGQRHGELARVRPIDDGTLVDHEVILGRVAVKQSRVCQDAREVGEGVLRGKVSIHVTPKPSGHLEAAVAGTHEAGGA